MDIAIIRSAALAALAVVLAQPAGAQDVPPAAIGGSTPTETLPSDPTIAPWAPAGGYEARPIAPERCKPAYPPEALHANTQGTTTLAFTIAPDGRVVDGVIVQSSGEGRRHKELDNYTLQAFAACPFAPGVDAQGKPTTTRFRLRYTWKID